MLLSWTQWNSLACAIQIRLNDHNVPSGLQIPEPIHAQALYLALLQSQPLSEAQEHSSFALQALQLLCVPFPLCCTLPVSIPTAIFLLYLLWESLTSLIHSAQIFISDGKCKFSSSQCVSQAILKCHY